MAPLLKVDAGAQTCAAYNSRIERIRNDEYPMLKDQVYLDHAGITLSAKSLIETFATEMSSMLIGNPHSTSTSSNLSTSRIEHVRMRVLRMFNADPAEFDVVFVANATAGIKLVAEAFRAAPDGFEYFYHQESHTSLVGVREEAYNSVCLDDTATMEWLRGHTSTSRVHPQRPTLFAYPAQSNLTGRRFPLSWCHAARATDENCLQNSGIGRVFTLLDAAAYVSTASLDLSDHDSAPDFTVLSFYKIFGFPNLGALIVRRQSAPILLGRKYFGGGTVDAVVCGAKQWHASKCQSIHEALEDGTLPIHSIIALDIAMETHSRLFGSMQDVSRHTSYLAKTMRHRVMALRHSNGTSVCVVYPNKSETYRVLGSGAVVALNLRNQNGTWVNLSEFQKLASLKGFHVRTGGMCNPGGASAALDLAPDDIKRNYAQGFRCGDDNDVIHGRPTGVIRVSLGAMSTMSDVDRFMDFIREFYLHQATAKISNGTLQHGESAVGRFVEDIIVYPIKSCRGFHVPKHMPWQVRPEGLMWDREWCLVHCATNRALSQKRYPRMALLQPTLDLNSRTMRISFLGYTPAGTPSSISVPLSDDMHTGGFDSTLEWALSRVCGDEVSIQRYTSDLINDFFSNALGVTCVLARLSPNNHNSSRAAKARHSSFQTTTLPQELGMPGSFPVVACNLNRQVIENHKILLANESPILAITSSSIRSLNETIEANGGRPVSAEVFRANIIIRSQSPAAAYSEDSWSWLRIGPLDFKVLGPCQRCHMICIDPKTGCKGAEPFVTLYKTRRFNGKVWFGIHLTMTTCRDNTAYTPEICSLQVGDNMSASVREEK